MKKTLAFMKKYPVYNASIHAIGGLGLGILIAQPILETHTVVIGIVLILLAIAGHVYTLFA